MSGGPETDQRAYLGQLYRRFASMVFRRARRLLADEQAAQDVTQEVFMRMLDAYPDPGGVAPSVGWLYQVTTNHCLNLLRDSKRRQALLAEHLPAGEPGREAETSVALLLRGVPEHLHEVAVYYYVDEMSQEEIAAVLAVSQRTISARLSEFKVVAQRVWRPAASQEQVS
jgi:RNA polymerase sigma-70 factor (ECF subfamily)